MVCEKETGQKKNSSSSLPTPLCTSNHPPSSLSPVTTDHHPLSLLTPMTTVLCLSPDFFPLDTVLISAVALLSNVVSLSARKKKVDPSNSACSSAVEDTGLFPLASAQFLPALMGAGLGHIYINPIPDSWKGLGKDGRTRKGRRGGDTHPHAHTPTHPHHAGALISPVQLCLHNSLSLMVHTLGSVCVFSEIPFQ